MFYNFFSWKYTKCSTCRNNYKVIIYIIPSNTKQKRCRNIIWFNPPFTRIVSTNVAKKILQLLGKHFPPSNSLHEIFYRNTIKLSYCCTQNLGNITKSHNKYLISFNNQIILPKEECPLEGKSRANNVVYKCIASATGFPNKVYLGTVQGELKKRFYNHNMSFKNESTKNDITLAKYIRSLKIKRNLTPTLKWHILKSVAPYSNITKKCTLCLQDRHNNFLLANYKANDWHFSK